MTNIPSIDPSFWSKTSCIQVGYGMWASLVEVTIGMSFGFPGVTFPQLIQKDSPILIKRSDEAWIANVLTLSAPVGCLISGYVMDKFGRKIILIICEVPVCVGLLCTGFASSVTHIIIGRAITGIGCGMAMGAPRAYITEITLPNMRGVVGVFPNVAESLGLALQALLGAFVKWKLVCFLAAIFSAAVCFSNCFIHETPYFMLLKSTEEDAKKSLQHFRAANFDIEKEMEEMSDFKFTNNIRRRSIISQIRLLFDKSTLKPFWITFMFLLITQLSGVTVIFIWAIDLLKGSNISAESNTGYLIMGVTRFSAGIFSSVLMYKIGKRPLALVSSFGVGAICLVLGIFIHYKIDPSVIPLFCYMIFVAFAMLGYYTIPLLLMYEIYPLQVKGLLGGITLSLLNFMIFGVNNAFVYLKTSIGYANIILVFGICSLLGFIYLYFYLPETMELTLQEIEEYFNDRRATLVSQRRVIAAQMSQASIRSIRQDASKTHSSDKHHKDRVNDVIQLRKKKPNKPAEIDTAERGQNKTNNNDNAK